LSDEKDIELPMEPVPGRTDQFVTTLPDGNRLVLTGQMPPDGGETMFEVHKAPDAEIVQPTDHMPGCGLTGPLTDGQHRCALCNASVELCGHNAAPFDGRCCDTCQQKRVLPRRVAIARALEKLYRATSSPFAAIEAKDVVISELFRPEALQALRLEELGDMAMMKTLASAEIVAWDSELEKAAVRGSESFDGMPWDVRPCNQLILLAGGIAVMLLVGEMVTHAIVLSIGSVRKPVKVMHAQIRRGQLIASAQFDRSVDTELKPGMFWHDMAALQRFMELEVVQRESARLPRQAVRAAQRAGKPLPKVIVVRLRRVYQERQTGESEVEWQHRWMVRGHWRKQWYSSTREHKLIYIAPFIKGPEGKPFLPPREVVKVVTR
jgi:hypothetical protein